MATSATLPLTILGRTVWPEHYFEEHDGFDSVGPYRHADILAIPEEYHLELITGHLVTSPAPLRPHQILCLILARLLDDIAEEHGGELLLSPMDVIFADDLVLQPDLVYISAERRQILGDHVHGVPDLVIEILSPTSKRRDQKIKFAKYQSHGVPEYWVFDLVNQAAELWYLHDGLYQLGQPGGEQKHYTSPLRPELSLTLGQIWQKLEQKLRGG